ncbi:MAG: hypothetical protein BJ554DRAFT_3319 [Olpidium bornovanus]|uniref:Uncharacterized protein n=1 Tax=Olpidium bornovanus TaxID=278681 RepID=A0A8H8DLE6_9FUNG|nr:MAG: hypothetical protein BJ554DRAFT_3319 [Olpidium bornovanus]
MQNANPVATPLEAGALEALTMTMAGDKEKNGEGGTERYQEAIGSLMWLATMTRPDLAFTVSFLSRFVASPSVKHWGAVKKALRYLAGTQRYEIHFMEGDVDNRLDRSLRQQTSVMEIGAPEVRCNIYL